jgi:hypothetical protein
VVKFKNRKRNFLFMGYYSGRTPILDSTILQAISDVFLPKFFVSPNTPRKFDGVPLPFDIELGDLVETFPEARELTAKTGNEHVMNLYHRGGQLERDTFWKEFYSDHGFSNNTIPFIGLAHTHSEGITAYAAPSPGDWATFLYHEHPLLITLLPKPGDSFLIVRSRWTRQLATDKITMRPCDRKDYEKLFKEIFDNEFYRHQISADEPYYVCPPDLNIYIQTIIAAHMRVGFYKINEDNGRASLLAPLWNYSRPLAPSLQKSR